MSRMGGVLNYADCFPEAVGSVDSVSGCEAGWASFTTLCSFLQFWTGAGAIPSCVTTRKNIFYGTSVKVDESRCGQAKFL